MEESMKNGWGEEISSLSKAAKNEDSSWKRVVEILCNG